MSDFIQYVIKRLLWAVPVLLGASFFAFIMMHLAPGDPARIMLGERASAEQVSALRRQLGLNRPLYVQYGDFVTSALQGDLGVSIRSRQEVSTLILNRAPYTIQLAVASLLIALSIAVPTGVIGALRRGKFVDHAGRITALMGISMPNFWLGLLLIFLIAVPTGWFPFFGMTLVTEDPRAAIESTLLPAIALGTALAALIMRLLRGGVLDELGRPYVRTARAFGIDDDEVIYVHALRNAVIPTITVVGLQLGYLMGGSVIIETVFGIPGMGQLAIKSIFAQDFPVIQGIILLVAVVFVVSNLIVDIVYALLDPRIGYGGDA